MFFTRISKSTVMLLWVQELWSISTHHSKAMDRSSPQKHLIRYTITRCETITQASKPNDFTQRLTWEYSPTCNRTSEFEGTTQIPNVCTLFQEVQKKLESPHSVEKRHPNILNTTVPRLSKHHCQLPLWGRVKIEIKSEGRWPWRTLTPAKNLGERSPQARNQLPLFEYKP